MPTSRRRPVCSPTSVNPAHTIPPYAPDTSVVVCAHTMRRLDQTLACLRAVIDQQPPPREVIVVVDHAPDLQSELATRSADAVTVVANEGRRGLSDGRNTGVRLAQGALIAFLDDDAVPRSGWLTALVRPFADPAVVVTGGRAEPLWPDDAPRWFPDEFLWVVGCSYRGMVDDGPVRNVIGCNMAFRQEAFTAAGGFDPNIGRLGSRPLGCEETELCIRVRSALPGTCVVAVSDSIVDHHVSADRVLPRYFASRCWHEGLSKARIARLSPAGEALSSERTYATRTLPAGVARAIADARQAGQRGSAAGRGTAIVGGLATTVLGYAAGATVYRRRLTVPPTTGSVT